MGHFCLDWRWLVAADSDDRSRAKTQEKDPATGLKLLIDRRLLIEGVLSEIRLYSLRPRSADLIQRLSPEEPRFLNV